MFKRMLKKSILWVFGFLWIFVFGFWLDPKPIGINNKFKKKDLICKNELFYKVDIITG